jgi:hypothetical protein
MRIETGAIRICTEHVPGLVRSANLSRRFWPDALRHFASLSAYWSDGNGLSAKVLCYSTRD